MKKFFVIAAVLLAACTAVNAENTTRIGSEHRVDYGAFLGWSTGDLAWYGMAFFDLNANNSNFRTRLSLGLAERWFYNAGIDANGKPISNGSFNPNLGLNFQYLVKLSDAFYFYPSVGVYGERFGKQGYNYHPYAKKLNFGLEGGLGLELQFSNNFGIFAEGTYQHMFTESVANRFGVRGGLVFHL